MAMVRDGISIGIVFDVYASIGGIGEGFVSSAEFWVTKGLSVAIALVEHPLLGAMRVEGLCWRGGFAG